MSAYGFPSTTTTTSSGRLHKQWNRRRLKFGDAERYICLETLSEPTRILKFVRAPFQQFSFALIKYGRNMSSTAAAFSPGSPALPAQELVLYVEQL